MTWTDEQLQKIKESLPRDGRKRLAEQFGFKPGSIRNILSGLSKNDDVVIAAIDMAKDYQETLNSKKIAADTL